MLISFDLRKSFHPDIAPGGLIIIVQQPYKGESWKQLRKHHANIGVWWTEKGDLSRTEHKVKSITLSESDSQFHGFSEEIIYPIRLTGSRAGASRLQTFQFLCYGWNNDVYMPHSSVERFILTESGNDSGSSWSLSYNGVDHILPDFDPTKDPINLLSVGKILRS